MKFTTINLGDNKIEVFNSFIGRETIVLNGKVVSEKNSITGATHHFKMIENDQDVACKFIFGYGLNGVVMSLYKDNKPVIESEKSMFFGFVFLTFIGFGFISIYNLILN
jgi:pilus assembly protein TadC